MSMYIMKPWYGGSKVPKQTTTFATSSSTAQFILYDTSPVENIEYIDYFVNNYPNISVSTASTTANTSWSSRTSSTVTYTYPLVLYSQIEAGRTIYTDNIYNRFSTNRTLIDLKGSDVTCSSSNSYSKYKENYTLSEYYSAYLSSLTYRNNTRNQDMRFYFYKTMSGNNAWITTDISYSNVSTAPLLPVITNRISVYPQLMFNVKSLVRKYSNNTKQTYYIGAYGYGAVIFEISDPYKITVKLDEAMTGGVSWMYSSASNTTYSTGSVTMYRATLTEVPA